MHAWGTKSGGACFGQAKHRVKGMPFPFTVLDSETGEMTARGYRDTLVWRDWEKQKGELFALAAEAAAKIK